MINIPKCKDLFRRKEKGMLEDNQNTQKKIHMKIKNKAEMIFISVAREKVALFFVASSSLWPGE